MEQNPEYVEQAIWMLSLAILCVYAGWELLKSLYPEE